MLHIITVTRMLPIGMATLIKQKGFVRKTSVAFVILGLKLVQGLVMFPVVLYGIFARMVGFTDLVLATLFGALVNGAIAVCFAFYERYRVPQRS